MKSTRSALIGLAALMLVTGLVGLFYGDVESQEGVGAMAEQESKPNFPIDPCAEAQHQKALDLMNSGQLAEAEKVLLPAVEAYEGERGPHYIEMLATLSIIYLRKGDIETYEEYVVEITQGSASPPNE